MKSVQLSNGVTVEFFPETGASAGVALAVKGSRNEPAAVSGVLHFGEHFLGFDNRRYPSRASFAVAIDRSLPDLTLETGKEALVAGVEIDPNEVPAALHGLADCLIDPRIVTSGVTVQQRIILEEESETVDSPAEYVSEVLDELIFAGHPLARPIVGTADHRSRFNAELTRQWLSRLVRDRLHLTVVGDFDLLQAQRIIRDRFGRLMMRPGEEPRRFTITQSRFRLRLINWPSRSVHIGLGIPLPFGFGHPDRLGLSVLNNHLGAPYRMSNRLRLCLVLQPPNLYWAWSRLWNYRETGTFTIATSCLPDKVTEVLTIIRLELMRLRDQALTPDEFTDAIISLRRQAKVKWRPPASRAIFLAEQRLVAGTSKTWQQYGQSIREVNPLFIQRLARRVIRPDRLNLVLLGPGVEQMDRRKIRRALRVMEEP